MSNSLRRAVPFDLTDEARDATIGSLQGWLPCLISSALRLKQAHWNLRGTCFKSVHEQLDEILVDVRDAVDDVAERIVTLGGAADGLPQTVSGCDPHEPFPDGLLTVEQATETICVDLSRNVQHGRMCLSILGEADPISEDLVIGVIAALEKHHWMLSSQLDL